MLTSWTCCGRTFSMFGTNRQWPMSIGLTFIKSKLSALESRFLNTKTFSFDLSTLLKLNLAGSGCWAKEYIAWEKDKKIIQQYWLWPFFHLRRPPHFGAVRLILSEKGVFPWKNSLSATSKKIPKTPCLWIDSGWTIMVLHDMHTWARAFHFFSSRSSIPILYFCWHSRSFSLYDTLSSSASIMLLTKPATPFERFSQSPRPPWWRQMFQPRDLVGVTQKIQVYFRTTS